MAAPTNLTATQNSETSPQIDFSWSGGTHYQYKLDDGDWGPWVSNTSGSVSITPEWGTKISFKVFGSGFLIAKIVTVPPPAPTGLTLKEDDSDDAEDGDLILSWNDPGNSKINGYEISTDDGDTWSAISNSDDTTTSHSLTGTDLEIQLRATSSLGKGEAVSLNSSVENLEARQTGAGSDYVTLSWDESGDKTLTYQIENDDDEWEDITLDSNEYTEHENNQYTIQLDRASSITKKIRAVSDYTGTTGSKSVTFTTAPAAPTNLTAVGGPRKITLNWDNPDNDNITRYQVHYGSGRWVDIPDSDDETTSYELTISYDKEYTLKVRAVSDFGRGAESSEVTASPLKVFVATVQVEDDQAVTGLPALVNLSRLKTLTLAEAQSIRVYDSLDQTTEYARDIMSATKMAIKLDTTTDVYIMYNGTDSDYDATATYGSEAVYSVLDSSIEGGSLADRAGKETIGEVGTVTYEDNGLWGKAFKIENNSNYPVIEDADDYTDKISITLIAKLTDTSGSNYRSLMSAGSSYNNGTGFDFYTLTSNGKWYTDKPGTANNYHTLSDTANSLSDFTVVQIEKTTTGISIEFDGVEYGSVSETGSFTNTDGNIKIGASTDGSNFIGSIEEIRLSKTTHSAAYKAAEVRNLKDQEAFWGEWEDVTVPKIVSQQAPGDPSPAGYTRHQVITFDKDKVESGVVNPILWVRTDDLNTSGTNIYDQSGSKLDSIIVTKPDGTVLNHRFNPAASDDPDVGGVMYIEYQGTLSSSVDTDINVWYKGGNTQAVKTATLDRFDMYLPLDEESGTQASDLSNHNKNGLYTGLDIPDRVNFGLQYGQQSVLDGRVAGFLQNGEFEDVTDWTMMVIFQIETLNASAYDQIVSFRGVNINFEIRVNLNNEIYRYTLIARRDNGGFVIINGSAATTEKVVFFIVRTNNTGLKLVQSNSSSLSTKVSGSVPGFLDAGNANNLFGRGSSQVNDIENASEFGIILGSNLTNNEQLTIARNLLSPETFYSVSDEINTASTSNGGVIGRMMMRVNGIY